MPFPLPGLGVPPFPENIDIIWNLTRVCPWDCKVCYVDAAHVAIKNDLIVIRSSGLSNAVTINRSLHPGDWNIVIATGLKLPSAVFVSDFALRHEVRGLHIPSTDHHRSQQFMPALFNEKNPGTRWSEHPLLCTGAEKIDVP